MPAWFPQIQTLCFRPVLTCGKRGGELEKQGNRFVFVGSTTGYSYPRQALFERLGPAISIVWRSMNIELFLAPARPKTAKTLWRHIPNGTITIRYMQLCSTEKTWALNCVLLVKRSALFSSFPLVESDTEFHHCRETGNTGVGQRSLGAEVWRRSFSDACFKKVKQLSLRFPFGTQAGQDFNIFLGRKIVPLSLELGCGSHVMNLLLECSRRWNRGIVCKQFRKLTLKLGMRACAAESMKTVGVESRKFNRVLDGCIQK